MPNTREKLIELIEKARLLASETLGSMNRGFGGWYADYLIANGVTVGKPLTEYLHPVDNYAGLKGKYLVFKADTGEQVVNCFVLRPDKDAAAVEALRAYARSTDNETLSNDIYNWVGKGVTVQEMNVVEVVRCKDCVYFRPAEDWNGKKYNACYFKPNVCIFEKKMEDFCSCGERKLPQPPKGD